MNRTSTAILKRLRHADEPVSGAQLSSDLSVSRNAVWKAVVALREDGFDIEGIQNRGYRLLQESDQLSVPGIESYLSDRWADLVVEVFSKITSTNTRAKEHCSLSSKRYLVAANRQTAGRGRRGRHFYSPGGSGLYFSLAMPWDRDISPTAVTTLAAVATSRVLEDTFDVDVAIKWVNDLFVEKKKVAGILTEATSDLETGCVSSVVIGIGINLTVPQKGYPEDIAHVAGAVAKKGEAIDRNRLIAAIVEAMGALVDALPDRGYMDEYRARSFILHREVTLDTGERIVPVDITDEGALVYKKDGERRELSSGEVRVTGY